MKWLGFALSASLLGGCSDASGPPGCTQIGCGARNGLEIQLTGNLPETFVITIPVGGSSNILIECSPSTPCDRVFLQDFTPVHVSISISGESFDFSADFVPVYQVTYPNTADSPPECQRATILVDVP
jgi:hypothetical protein